MGELEQAQDSQRQVRESLFDDGALPPLDEGARYDEGHPDSPGVRNHESRGVASPSPLSVGTRVVFTGEGGGSGAIRSVRDTPWGPHYRVDWDDGQESPEMGEDELRQEEYDAEHGLRRAALAVSDTRARDACVDAALAVGDLSEHEGRPGATQSRASAQDVHAPRGVAASSSALTDIGHPTTLRTPPYAATGPRPEGAA